MLPRSLPEASRASTRVEAEGRLRAHSGLKWYRWYPVLLDLRTQNNSGNHNLSTVQKCLSFAMLITLNSCFKVFQLLPLRLGSAEILYSRLVPPPSLPASPSLSSCASATRVWRNLHLYSLAYCLIYIYAFTSGRICETIFWLAQRLACCACAEPLIRLVATMQSTLGALPMPSLTSAPEQTFQSKWF